MLDIRTLFVYVSAFFEAFLKTSALHTGPAVGEDQYAAHLSGTLVLYKVLQPQDKYAAH